MDYCVDVWRSLRLGLLPNNVPECGGIFSPDHCKSLTKEYIVEPMIIGQGSFGTVRRVRLKSNKDGTNYSKFYACKTILKSQIEDLDLLRREVNNLNRCCRHPNIIQLLDVAEDDRAIHLIMERCTGGELYSQVLNARSAGREGGGGLDEMTAVRIVHQILSAIAYCHEVGHVCHRDLKASNFLFVSPGVHSDIRVIDFGLSKHVTCTPVVDAAATTESHLESSNGADVDTVDTENVDELSGSDDVISQEKELTPSPGTIDGHDTHDETLKNGCGYMTSEVGTPYYVAPEVLTQDKYTMKCDVWSVGCIAYLCLSGRLPVQGKDERETVHRLMDPLLEVDFTDQVWNDDEGTISSAAQDFCKALLQRDPGNRPTSKEALSLDWMVNHYGSPQEMPPPLSDDTDPPLPGLSVRGGRRLRQSVSSPM